MALLSGAATVCVRSTCKPSLNVTSLATRTHSSSTKPPSRALLTLQGTSFTRKLDSGKCPPQAIRFTSPFFVDSTLVKLRSEIENVERPGGKGGACASSCSIVLSPETLRWIITVSAALLMLLRNTAINKAFLVPLLALQAPGDVINWLRGEYGLWAAFLALLVRLFYYIPGELELPLMFVLLIITSPYQAMDFRGTAAATILCAGVSAYLAYQHFTKAGGIKGSFREGTFLASLAIICLVSIPFIFFFQGF